MLRQNSRRRTEEISAPRVRSVQTHRSQEGSPAGPKTLAGQVVGQPEELLAEETTLRQIHQIHQTPQTRQKATRETDEIALGPQNVPILVAPHRGVARHQEEIRQYQTPPTTRATPVVRAATSQK